MEIGKIESPGHKNWKVFLHWRVIFEIKEDLRVIQNLGREYEIT